MQDFRGDLWLCTGCEQIAHPPPLEPSRVYPIGLSWIMFASFAMILIGMIMMALASFTQGQGVTGGGAIILIGPIPIILGGGPQSTWLILLGAIITVIALVVLLFSRRRTVS